MSFRIPVPARDDPAAPDEFRTVLDVRSRWWRVGNSWYPTLGQALRVEWLDPVMKPWWWAADRWGGYRVDLLTREGEWMDFGRYFTRRWAEKAAHTMWVHHNDTMRVVEV